MPEFAQDDLTAWSIALVVGVPLLVVILTEIIERLAWRGHPLTGTFRWARNVVLPLSALVLLLRYILGYGYDTFATRLATTLLLLGTMVMLFRLSHYLLARGDDAPSWRENVPLLFLQIVRFLLLLLVFYLIVGQIWNVDVGRLVTAFGIGSLVVALALQEPLSNLFAGLLLQINRPFQQGEWIRVGQDEGTVVEVNWRHTAIRTRDNDLIIIPNGAMAKNSFKNYSRPTRLHRLGEEFDFHVKHPPNQVLRMLYDAALDTPGVLADPEPDPRTVSYDGYSIHYKIFMWVEDYGPVQRVRNRFVTSVYYHAQRQGLTWMRREQHLFHFDGLQVDSQNAVTVERRARRLRALPAFDVLPEEAVEDLASQARLLEYGEGEPIMRKGEREQGLYVILNGHVSLAIQDDQGLTRELSQLHSGDVFGETGLFSRAISSYDTTALSDVELLRIPHRAVNEVINVQPRFANELSTLLESRRKLLEVPTTP
jgi:small-conductance mechanosensitive channel